ncbi:DgyrCDS8121 [Dimorphilus gyrociliatus]|uniref:DgyrCDS8121 n=1 Tax=Dimorphilus gyrociliatus TaxID=2664684 RepID=A0A7I8VVH9_9ANNE|nr:DgyrCDS8121 [Dimorphilus gyrociliatus]
MVVYKIEKEACSLESVYCVDIAICQKKTNDTFVCICPDGYEGNGKKAKEGEDNTGCKLPDCPENMKEFGDEECIAVLSEPKTFEEAEKQCNSKFGGNLLSITNENQLEELAKIAPATDNLIFIGATDIALEGHFVWNDQASNVYMPWKDGEPSQDDRKKNCVALDASSKFKFTTEVCTIPHPYFCSTARVKRQCKKGWTLINGECIFVSSEEVTYSDAYLRCSQNGAELVTITSRAEADKIFASVPFLTNIPYWTGLTDGYLDAPDGSLAWANGNPIAYYPLQNPDVLASGKQFCVTSSIDSKWTAQKCTQKYGFICQKTPGKSKKCPPGSYRFGEKCYKVKSTEGQSFNEAKMTCKTMGGDLLSINSAGEQEFIANLLNTLKFNQDLWIGLYEKSVKLNFTWTDNTPAEYYNWVSGEPNLEKLFSCVKMSYGDSYAWKDIECATKLPYICEYNNTPCKNASQCHEDAECHMGQCRCAPGKFDGDGKDVCIDINECEAAVYPCHEKANCNNLKGDYECKCKEDYVQNGLICIHRRWCEKDEQCNKNGYCNKTIGLCECNSGWEGDGKDECHDIDECVQELHNCHKDAICTNLDGKFHCDCKDGFVGNGTVCQDIPLNCDDFLRKHPDKAKNGPREIDPDGPGGVDPFLVECLFENGYGITLIETNIEKKISLYNKPEPESFTKTVIYKNDVTILQLIELIVSSKFCYQDLSFDCNGKINLLENGYWVSSDGVKQRNWGSMLNNNTCTCGEIGACKNEQSACNCDGSGKGQDWSRIIERNKLPIKEIVLGGIQSSYAKYFVGPLKCSSVQFDIPKDCDDLKKNYEVEDNGVYLIDPDGPNGDESGNLPPYNVYCDMETYSHVGVTEIPHLKKGPGEGPGEGPGVPKGPGDQPIVYPYGYEILLKLKKISLFCMQKVTYECQNSRIFGGGEIHTTWNRQDGLSLKYFPGASGREETCACGLTKSCNDPNVKCNCDIVDGEWRKDLGVITNKEDLPLGNLNVKDIGTDKNIRYTVSRLMCSTNQFGIEPTCQVYRRRGEDYSYAYLIDPDGPVNPKSSQAVQANNVEPFLVSCEMYKDIQIGVTVVGHDTEDKTTVSGKEEPGSYHKDVTYLESSYKQLIKLADRSAYCQQSFEYECTNSSLINEDKKYGYWIARNDAKKYYFNGIKGTGCACSGDNSCDGGKSCNCFLKDGKTRTDIGMLSNRKDLPVTALNFGDTGDEGESGAHKLGKLRCFEIFKTCAHMWNSYKRPLGEHKLPHGRYVIDPDEYKILEPFEVICEFPRTKVLVVSNSEGTTDSEKEGEDNNKPFASCTKPQYMKASKEQLRALTEESVFCSQNALYRGQNAPLSTHFYWKSREGDKIPGWAGNAGGNECACGETDRCDGGPSAACNTDMDDDTLRTDKGLLFDKTILPISEACMGYKLKAGKVSKSTVVFHALYCSNYQFGIEKDCQQYRNKKTTETGTMIIDPDGGSGSSSKPFPAYCEMIVDPPIGITIITHKKEVCQNIKADGETISLTYNAADNEQIGGLITASQYCTQFTDFQCNNAELLINDQYGWYQNSDEIKSYWGGNTGGQGCKGGKCNCDGTDKTDKQDGGLLLNKEDLPIKGGKFQKIDPSGSRCWEVDSLKCYNIYKHCEQIRLKNARYNPLRNNRYAIDPDGAGGNDIFGVTCDFKYNKRIGITLVKHDQSGITNVAQEHSKVLNYFNVIIPQIRGLIKESEFCSQKLIYTCRQAVLLNDMTTPNSYFKDWSGAISENWANADKSSVQGCACRLLKTCPENFTCRCDSKLPVLQDEGGWVTNKNKLPVSEVSFDGISKPNGKGYYSLGTFGCGPQPFYLPTGCKDAAEKGYKTGEILIRPNDNLDPFIVYCNMEGMNSQHKAITTLINSETVQNVVNYMQASYEQVKEVVNQAKYCYLPVKVNCQASPFLSAGNGWIGRSSKILKYFGSGSPAACTCGKEKRCGGHDGRAKMSSRLCNCDASDSDARVDAGIIKIKNDLPLEKLVYNIGSSANASVSLTVGTLYCSDSPFDLDECQLGFHDCHELAKCSNTKNGFTCTCKVGYRALGVPDKWANGRECYDDNECNLNKCPKEATCENIPGSFICHCKEGFKKVAPTACSDINECQVGTHNCDVNANCINTYGSFYCTCKDGYRGDGIKGTCVEIGKCTCFGDPHCVSFDKKWNHFQGDCQYVLARDGCENGLPKQAAEFQVIQQNWRGAAETIGRVSWTKEVYVFIYGQKLSLLQKGIVYYNGVKIIRLPSRPHAAINIKRSGRFIHVTTTSGLEVKWSGDDKVEVIVPADMKTKMCGICGNYNGNATDDWMVAEGCPDSGYGKLTDNVVTFGQSWEYLQSGEECKKDCDATNEPLCNEQEQIQATIVCKELFSKLGRFKSCLKKMTDEEIQNYIYACEFDLCHTDDNMQLALCSVAQSLVDRCQEDLKIPIRNWRSSEFCPLLCGEGQIYSPCGNPCQPSCNNTMQQTNCITTCIEGCVCKEGLVMDGNRCIKPDECGCEHDGFYYSVGDREVKPQCTEECTCNNQYGEPDCKPLKCSDDATCKIEEGSWDCYCNEGYKGDGKTCDDVDECSLPKYPCDANADCKNEIGSYTCTCRKGFEGDGKKCTDVNECLLNLDNCDVHADCKNTFGSFECNCKVGYKKDPETKVCVDVNECETGRDRCNRGSTECINTEGSYACACKKGFEELDRISCSDINECANPDLNDCHENANCQNLVGSFTCTCKDGYKGDGKDCQDYDECKNADWNECHEKASCSNTVGSYTCSCINGFSGDGRKCDDINECDKLGSSNKCQSKEDNAKCVNTIGDYTCGCLDGYSGDGLKDGEGCDNVNECLLSPPICGPNSQCTDNIGSYTCKCDEDHISSSNDGKNCEPVKKCKDNTITCTKTEICVNTPTGPVCECLPGYHRNDEGACEDDNECTTGEKKCDKPLQECVNLPGNYKCQCKDGYKANENGVCIDINECDNGDHDCKGGSECKNTIGGFTCECKEGFVKMIDFLSGGLPSCEDINECLSNKDDCDKNAECINTAGSYTCKCKEGFYGNGKKCDDITECFDFDEKAGCDENAECLELPGKFECKCHKGYEGNGYNCTNINECTRNIHDCHQHSECVDTPGAYICKCRKGFSGHCDACEDIDECLTNTHDCSERADCKNTLGGFECNCKNGYTGNGKTCVDINECELGTHTCGPNAECQNLVGSFKCICNAGFSLDEKKSCDDDNECTSSNHFCHENAHCVNTVGSYNCQCKPGYIGNGLSCKEEDPDSCGGKICDHMARCATIANTPVCICKFGYQGSGEVINGVPGCVETDPCKDNKCDKDATCYSGLGIPVCKCNTGFAGDGFKCEEVDPCDDTDICGNGAICTKVGLEAQCSCPNGFGMLNGRDCIDIDECVSKTDSCGENFECKNTIGSFKCVCQKGFRLDIASGKCIDINECDDGTHDCDDSQRAICENRAGSYYCACKLPRYKGDGKKCEEVPDEGCGKSCPEGSYCTLADGSPKCVCRSGYTSVSNPDGTTTCTDINECTESNSLCSPNADCVNEAPGYSCICKKGFVGNGKTCEDINECSSNLHDCPSTSDCENTIGSFKCKCKRGYKGDGRTCTLIPSDDDICGCGPMGICESDTGKCFCKPGYIDDTTRTTDKCKDADDCLVPKRCHPLAKCIDKIGGYKCECPPGYAGDGENYCDEDECSNGRHQCSEHAICENTPTFYTCKCKEGFRGNGWLCYPIADPCGDKNCGDNALCVNNNGKSECICQVGYVGDGEKCVDVNECTEEGVFADDCHVHARCFNFDGGYACSCENGYKGDGKDCSDVNECTEDKHNCSPYATCENRIGGYECKCKPGYKGDGKVCKPDGSCSNNGGCQENSECSNELSTGGGGYVCVCKTGFRMVNGKCEDIDECIEKSHTCHLNATCQNTIGSFVCACKPGFRGNGHECKDINECWKPEDNTCNDREDCENLIGGYILMNVHRMNSINAIQMRLAQMKLAATSVPANMDTKETELYVRLQLYVFKDINECKLGIANCHTNSLCLNLPGTFACGCLRGFIGDGVNCTDIDECANDDLNECDPNADCFNRIGYYLCTCKAGYEGDGKICIKPKPCDKPNVCHEKANCLNVGDSAQCSCKPPLRGDGIKECYPVNECELGEYTCHPLAHCVDKYEGYDCVCKAGYWGDGKTYCNDVDECDPSKPGGGGALCISGSGAICVNSPAGSYSCSCPQGKELDNSGRRCENTNECNSGAHNCTQNSECKDLDPGFKCVCKYGYEEINGVCTDKNECDLNEDTCDSLSRCVNTDGSYVCVCKVGYSKSRWGKCVDIDECKFGNKCGEKAICVNTKGSYLCTCPPGYTGDPKDKCVDIDECLIKTDPCHEYAECTNVPGSCTCTCKEGYIGDGIICEEVDKCGADIEHKCAPNAYCVRNESQADKYSCACKSGFLGDGYKICEGDRCFETCHDKNECAFDLKVCSPYATCENVNGGFMCKCKPGYGGTGKECTDIDECGLDKHGCDKENGICTNVEGSYKCRCASGYEGNGKTCTQINECERGTHDCHKDGECIDNDGSYACKCKQGFNGDGKTCIDINECLQATALCSEDSECINTPGSYECKCHDGYVKEGNTCVDINECLSTTEPPCPNDCICLNSKGSYKCVCKAGYRQIGEKQCEDINECELEKFQKICSDKKANCANKPGSYECVCPEGFEFNLQGICEDINECLLDGPNGEEGGFCGSGSLCENSIGGCKCLCSTGMEPPNGKTCGHCDDIDECNSVRYPHNCPQEVSECINEKPGFRCKCSAGYEGDGYNCTDINECEVDSHVCSVGDCINTVGSYKCECPGGYGFDGKTCTDIDECQIPKESENTHNCDPISSTCINIIGSFKCECKPGFTQQGDKCVDKNECQDPLRCGLNVECINTVGSYKCNCRLGQIWNGIICHDKDECLANPDICGGSKAGKCVNVDGSYKCECYTGYKLVNNKCKDIDECIELRVVCGNEATCLNNEGGFECKCPPGYIRDGNTCKNKDECQEDNTCDPNAYCIDIVGSYKCHCKEGYKGDGKTCNPICGPNTCLPQQTCLVIDNERAECKCLCEGPICTNKGEVCGDDFTTYPSDARLIIDSCKAKKVVKRLYRGKCRDGCEGNPCGLFRSCVIVDNVPTCICDKCTDEEINSGKICTKKGDTYNSICELKTLICRLPQLNDEVKHLGACNTPVDCKYSDWTEWTKCSKECGEGTKSRSRQIIQESSNNGQPCRNTTVEIPCKIQDCPGDPCATKACRSGAICVVRGGEAECECPSCKFVERSYVCGLLGNETVTASSTCVLKRNACLHNKPYGILHAGKCEDGKDEKPLNCTAIPIYSTLKETSTDCVTETLLLNHCMGGCGERADKCCKPSERETKSVKYQCPDGTAKTKQLKFIKSCHCILKELDEKNLEQEEMDAIPLTP